MTSNIIFTLCTMLFIISSVALVLVILVQKPQGGGLSAAFGAGGGASQTAFGTKTGDMLTLGTVGVFVFFIGISITLVLLSGARYGSRSGLPNAPTNLVANAQTHNSVQLTWSDESNNESRFTIERALTADAENEAWLSVWSTVDNIETFDDSTVLPSTTYYYRVYSLNASGPSAPTEVAEATTPAAPDTTPVDENLDTGNVDNGANATSEDGTETEGTDDSPAAPATENEESTDPPNTSNDGG